SSHELSEVDMLCDRILLIHQGKLVEERQMDDLKDELRKYVLTYVGKDPDSLLGAGWFVGADQTLSKRFRSKSELLAAIERVQTAGGKLVDVVAEEGSLE